jgi:hypothetical protein
MNEAVEMNSAFGNKASSLTLKLAGLFQRKLKALNGQQNSVFKITRIHKCTLEACYAVCPQRTM